MTARATTTFVFTDLVGSTALVGRVDSASAEGLRQEHFTLLRDALRRHHGHEVKNLGDGLMVAFASVADAVDGAVAMQQRLHHRNRTARLGLNVRVGISVGDAIHEDDDYFGRPVVEAARLCSAARGGQILASEAVRAIVGEREGQAFDAVGQLELKGLPEPLRTFEVMWEPAGGEALGALPLPPVLRAGGALGFFGRRPELDLLRSTWAACEQGTSQVAFVAGEPGIGKTRLVSEIAVRAHDEGATVLFGRCHENLGVAYEPFIEVLRHYASLCPVEVLDEHVRTHGGELTRLVPEVAARVADVPPPRTGDAESERYWLFDAIASLIAAAAQERPLVLVLDDLHWASTSTLLLLRHLIEVPEPMPLLVMGTFRSVDPGPAGDLADLLADLRRETDVVRIDLTGLSGDEVVQLMEARAGHELGPVEDQLARGVARDSDGSPFFVTEILRHLRESGAIVEEDGRWRYRGDPDALAIPESVRDVIARRIRRFDADTVRILECASVVGRDFDLGLVAAMADRPRLAVLSALEVAEAAALVATEPGRGTRFSFQHALVQHTLYDGQRPTHRMALHLAAFEALAALDLDGSRVFESANHAARAGDLVDVDRAIDAASRAAARALDEVAHEQAVVHYQHALDLLPAGAPDERRYDLLLALATAQRGLSGTEFRQSLFAAIDAARRLGDGTRVARAAVAVARTGTFSSVGEVDDQIVAVYTDALADLGDDDPRLRALLLGRLAVEVVFSETWERRVELCDEAIALARADGDPAVVADVVAACIQALYDQTTTTSRLALTAELLEAADRLDAPEIRFRGHLERSGALLELGEVEDARVNAAEAARLAEEIGRPLLRWHAAIATGWEAVVQGPEVAEARAFEIFALNPEDKSAVTAVSAHLFVVRWDQGRLAELIGLLEERVAEMPLAPAWRGGLGVALCEEGRLDEARDHFEWFAARDFQMPRDYVWWTGMVNASEVCVALRDQVRAERLLELIAPWAHQVAVLGVGMSTFGAGNRIRATLESLLGRYEEAEEHFEEALVMNERLGAATFLVRTRRAYADMLLARGGGGDAERATALATTALADAARLGMAREVERLTALLPADLPTA